VVRGGRAPGRRRRLPPRRAGALRRRDRRRAAGLRRGRRRRPPGPRPRGGFAAARVPGWGWRPGRSSSRPRSPPRSPRPSRRSWALAVAAGPVAGARAGARLRRRRGWASRDRRVGRPGRGIAGAAPCLPRATLRAEPEADPNAGRRPSRGPIGGRRAGGGAGPRRCRRADWGTADGRGEEDALLAQQDRRRSPRSPGPTSSAAPPWDRAGAAGADLGDGHASSGVAPVPGAATLSPAFIR
jgi:hypothetical protein